MAASKAPKNAPSKTGNESGKGRGNNPPAAKKATADKTTASKKK